jgi:hypothetical protein
LYGVAARARRHRLRGKSSAAAEQRHIRAGEGPLAPGARLQGRPDPAWPGSSASVKWALVRPDGGIAAQSGGITLAAHPSTGTYILNFGGAITGKPILASGGYAGDPGDQRGETTAGPCGGGSEGRTCPSGFDTTSNLIAQTRSNDGTPTDHAFYVVVFG